MRKYCLLFILLAILMMFSSFATGCQHVSASSTTPVPTALLTPMPSPVPTRMKKVPYIEEVGHVNKVVNTETENISIKFDADVKISGSKEYPIVELVPKKITQEQVDNFLDTFFPKRENITSWWLDMNKPLTKKDINEQIKLREKWIADTKESIPKNAKGKSIYIPKWEKQIEHYKKFLIDAPNDESEITLPDVTKLAHTPINNRESICNPESYERELEIAKRDEMNNTKHLNYTFTHKNEECDTYEVYHVSAHQSDRPQENSFQLCGNQSFYDDKLVENYNDIPELQTTYIEAKKLADKAISVLGLYDLDLYKASIYNNSYCFTYTYDVEGTNVAYSTHDRTYHFYIAINDKGIVSVYFHEPAEFCSIIRTENELLPFQEIMNKACDRFDSEEYLYNRFLYEENGDLKTKKYDVLIDKVELGYMMIKGFGTGIKSYSLVPVWDFYGREDYFVTTLTYESNIANTLGKRDNENTQNRLLTINAINGQVIDRRTNYWRN